jgi:hypothetical protein
VAHLEHVCAVLNAHKVCNTVNAVEVGISPGNMFNAISEEEEDFCKVNSRVLNINKNVMHVLLSGTISKIGKLR